MISADGETACSERDSHSVEPSTLQTRAALTVLSITRSLMGARLRWFAYRRIGRPLSRRLRGRYVVSVREGYRLRIDLDDIVGAMLVSSGVWEPSVTAVFRAVLRPGDIAVDVGAHLGYFTVLAGRLVGEHGKVYALEPSPATFVDLLRNVELNGLQNVVPLRVAAGPERGQAPLLVPPDGNSGRASLVEWFDREDAERRVVEVEPLHRVLAQRDAGRLALVKIDVEGYEEDVLRGLEPVLETGSRPIVVLEVHGPFVERICAYLEGLCTRFDLVPYELLEPGGERVAVSHRPLETLLVPSQLAELRNGLNVTLVIAASGALRLPGSDCR